MLRQVHAVSTAFLLLLPNVSSNPYCPDSPATRLSSPSVVKHWKHRHVSHSRDASGCTYSDQDAHSICVRRHALYSYAHIPRPRMHPIGARIADHPRTLYALVCVVSVCTLSRMHGFPPCAHLPCTSLICIR